MLDDGEVSRMSEADIKDTIKYIPSDSTPGLTYRIYRDSRGQLHCSCPDHVFREKNCKHLLKAFYD